MMYNNNKIIIIHVIILYILLLVSIIFIGLTYINYKNELGNIIIIINIIYYYNY